MSADVLRRAAALMRSRAEAAGRPWHPWSDESLPIRQGVQAWADEMNGYLGGEWGVHAGSWHPAVALAVADWLDETAEFFNPNSAIWGRALAVARAYLNEPDTP